MIERDRDFGNVVDKTIQQYMKRQAVAIILPRLPVVGGWCEFVSPPPVFFVFLMCATLAYLALVELTKAGFYRVMAKTQTHIG